MARKVVYIVFLLPIIISVPIAAYVLADILNQPGRELDMWPIGSGSGHGSSTNFVSLYDLSGESTHNELVILKTLDIQDLQIMSSQDTIK